MFDFQSIRQLQFSTRSLFLFLALLAVGLSFSVFSVAPTVFVAAAWGHYYRHGDLRSLIACCCLTVAFLMSLAAWNFESNYGHFDSSRGSLISFVLLISALSTAGGLLCFKRNSQRRGGWLKLSMSFGVLLSIALAGFVIAANRGHRNMGTASPSKIRQLIVSILNFESKEHSLPRNNANLGNPSLQHSWRVQILPHLGEQALYESYNFDEPWDGPNNRRLAVSMPAVYRGSLNNLGCLTPFKLVSGIGSAFEDRKTAPTLGNILDGSQTIALIEDSDNPVHWMEPLDISIDQAVGLFDDQDSDAKPLRDSLFVAYYKEGISFACFDGSTHGYISGYGETISKAHFTVAGGEPVNLSSCVFPIRIVKFHVLLKFLLYCLLIACSPLIVGKIQRR